MQAERRVRTTQARWLAAVLAAAVGVAGCRGGRDSYSDQREKANAALAVAKTYLAEGRYTDAKLQFEDILTEIDGTNAQARFGAVLAELLQFVSIIRVVNQLTGGDIASADENEFLHALVDDLLTDLISRFDDMAFELKRLKTDATFRFVLEDDTFVYLTSTDTPDLNLKGEWDRGEVFLLDAGIQAVLGILNLAQSVELRADYLSLFNKFTELDIQLDLDGDDLGEVLANIETQVPKFQVLATYALNENPRLLGLDRDTGAAQMSAAGLHLANAIDSLRKALFFASKDIEFDRNQDDDFIAFAPADDQGPIDPDVDLCAVRDRADEDEISAHTYTFLIRVADVPDADEPEVTLESGPITGCFVTKLLATLLPADDARLADLGSQYRNAHINLTEDIVPFALDLLGDAVPSLIKPETIRDFIGNSVEVDLKPFFHDAVGMRDLLVAWDTPAMEADPDLRLVWAELECKFDTVDDDVASQRAAEYPEFGAKLAAQPYRMFDRLYCREDENATIPTVLANCDLSGGTNCDMRHFPAHNDVQNDGLLEFPALAAAFGISPIGADGSVGQLPYLAFQDPSFNRLLYLDVAATASAVLGSDVPAELRAIDDDRGFALADQRSLNAYVSLISQQITPFLDLLD